MAGNRNVITIENNSEEGDFSVAKIVTWNKIEDSDINSELHLSQKEIQELEDKIINNKLLSSYSRYLNGNGKVLSLKNCIYITDTEIVGKTTYITLSDQIK